MEPQSKQKILVVIIILAAAIAGGLWFQPDILTLLKPRSAAPAAGQPPIPPPPPENAPLAGNIIALTPTSVTIGGYRIESNRPVLSSERTVRFTPGTIFMRQGSAVNGGIIESVIRSADLKIGDVVNVFVNSRDKDAAERVILLNLPPPPPPSR